MNQRKDILIHARFPLPAFSCKELESLKDEIKKGDTGLKSIFNSCSIYFIVKRCRLYFDDVHIVNDEGKVKFNIAEKNSEHKVRCEFSLTENQYLQEGDEDEVVIELLSDEVDKITESKDGQESHIKERLEAIRLFDRHENFLTFLTPQRFLYDYLQGSLKASVYGEFSNFFNYKVEYIGKASGQSIENRLTGHEKIQKILSEEWVASRQSDREISIIFLSILGFTDFRFSDVSKDFDAQDSFSPSKINASSQELTAEVEAMLVNSFKPPHNKKLFKNYPDIKKGTRSVGYTNSHLLIENSPFTLSTDAFSLDQRITKIS